MIKDIITNIIVWGILATTAILWIIKWTDAVQINPVWLWISTAASIFIVLIVVFIVVGISKLSNL